MCVCLCPALVLPLACLNFAVWLVPCQLPPVLIRFGSWLSVLWLGWFPAGSCLALLSRLVLASGLPVLSHLAGFVLFRACKCFVPRFCRLPACILRFGCCVPASACTGSFLALGCIYFVAWLFSCRLLLGPASRLVLASGLSVLSALTGFVPFCACTCFVAGAWFLPACALCS